jgi:hypothetical protein
VFVVVCLRRFVVVAAFGRFFVEEFDVADAFGEQDIVIIVVLVAFSSGFVDGRIVKIVEDFVEVSVVKDL